MRITIFALLLATCVSAHAQTTEAAISARLMNHPLYLRGFWSSTKLHFDSVGHLQGDSKAESFTLSGFDLEAVHLTSSNLILDGRRVGVEFHDGQAARVPLEANNPRHHKDVKVHIEISASPDGDYGPALDTIFADDLSALAPSLPTYWRECAAHDFQRCGTTKPKPIDPPSDQWTKPPVLRHSKEPKFTPEARKLLYDGIGLYKLAVNADGIVSDITILRPLGIGLDENAIEALHHYTFTPATKDGASIPCVLNVQIKLQIF